MVSLTLTPMLCSKFLVREINAKNISNKKSEANIIKKKVHTFFVSLEKLYAKILRKTLNNRWKVLFLSLLVVLSSSYFFSEINKELVPETDESRFTVRFKTPLGSNMDYTYKKLLEIEEKIYTEKNNIASVFSSIGLGSRGQVNRGFISVRLIDKELRNTSQSQIMKNLSEEFSRLAGVKAFPAGVTIAGGQRSEKLKFSLIGPSIEKVAALSKELSERLSKKTEIGKIDLDLQLNLPQLILDIDREKATSLGISAKDIAESISVLSNGLDVARFNDFPGDGQRYEIRLKAKEGTFKNTSNLNKIYLRGNGGELIRLDTIASFKEVLGPAVISRESLQYSANFYTDPSMPLGEAISFVNSESASILPSDYKIQLDGQAKEFAKTTKNVLFVFMLATLLLYMVLASLFNSFFQPIIVMLAQPLAVVGGIALLWLTDKSLNIYSMIGLVLLIGLVAKNSILLIDLTNQLRAKGKETNAALLEACPVRLRPVLMTSITLILALLPAALGLGAGSEENGPLAIAVIGGMISSTLLTLIVIPAAFSLSVRFIEKK
jgi:HAE1 family hydrophobic/amphiphilic exporter-1